MSLAEHKRNQVYHTLRRFKQRHGLSMTESSYANLCRQIRRKESVLIGKNRYKQHHLVQYGLDLYKVVFDLKTKKIATVLPGKWSYGILLSERIAAA